MALRHGALAVGALSVASACSLLTSLGDLSAGDPPATTATDAASAAADAESGTSPADASPGDAAPSPRLAAYRDAVLADGPHVYLRLEETTGRVAADETGAHPGEYVGDPQQGVPGILGGKALGIRDGIAAFVKVPSSEFRYAGRAPFTVELWVRPTLFRDFLWIIGTEDWYAPRQGWSLLTFSEELLLYEVWAGAQDGGWTLVRAPPTSARKLVAGAWQHVVVTYDGSTVRSYQDGTLSATRLAPTDAPATGDALNIGCRVWRDGTSSGCFDGGEIDEVALYDKALPAAAVAAHWDLGKP